MKHVPFASNIFIELFAYKLRVVGLTLQATDKDKSDEFGTMSLVYSLQGGPSNVIIVEEIDQNGFPQGKLYATGKFDFETDSSILLQVFANNYFLFFFQNFSFFILFNSNFHF